MKLATSVKQLKKEVFFLKLNSGFTFFRFKSLSTVYIELKLGFKKKTVVNMMRFQMDRVDKLVALLAKRVDNRRQMSSTSGSNR